jgi:hypothetical protein
MVYPGLASWAKFSRPYGTKFVNPGSDADSMAPEGLILKAQDFEPPEQRRSAARIESTAANHLIETSIAPKTGRSRPSPGTISTF